MRPFKCQINNLEQNGNAGRERITPVHRPASLLDVDEMRRYITLSTDRCEFLIHASFVMINDRNAILKKKVNDCFTVAVQDASSVLLRVLSCGELPAYIVW